MIYTSKGELVTARPYPKMVLLTVSFGTGKMVLSAPDIPDFVLDTEILESSPKISSEMDGYNVDTIDCGDEVSTWLSRYITDDEKSNLRLRFYPHQAPTRPIHPDLIKFKLIKPKDVVSLVHYLYNINFPLLFIFFNEGCFA